MSALHYEQLARLPAPGDNVAIATRRLEAGTRIDGPSGAFALSHTVLEGHRFVLTPIARGQDLTSWGLPFGVALDDLAAGTYVCNQSILDVLSERSVDVELPTTPNFEDRLERYEFDPSTFRPGVQVRAEAAPETFDGYPRPGGRGVGTRNFVVVLGVTAASGPLAQAIANRFEDRTPDGVDGVVAIQHTEGGGVARPNNLEFVLRTLAGFLVHPNVAAVLAVDLGDGGFTGRDIEAYARRHDYPLEHVPHAFLTADNGLDRALESGVETVTGWLDAAAAARRETVPVSHLKVALQCGGSDAFSGISGNALAGWVAKQVIASGGSANLAETDELIGAEPYVLSNVRDADTAKRFLDKIETFKTRASHHGASAEGNPSGGNKLRGLYNIALKSIGAARKLDPEVRLDHVIDYGAPMDAPGYYFMDSPGNDLESIAGQVASGCNLIFFITGNGSITNFPFVPTLKFVTTSGRFRMLEREMDVNAGRYNDGMEMDALGRETFDLARAIASGQPSKGELAGHAQVQIWRDWRQTGPQEVQLIRHAPRPDGRALAVRDVAPSTMRFRALRTERGPSIDQVGLVMPTSLCSGQVARVVAEQLNARSDGPRGVSRYVALVHTEGCGSANADDIFLRTLGGHLSHGFTRRAMLLEHGCEKTHNDAVRHYLGAEVLDEHRVGFASVQLDGGMAAVSEKIARWFDEHLARAGECPEETVDAGALRLGLFASGPLADDSARLLARLAGGIVAAGGRVIVPETGSLAASAAFATTLLADGERWRASLDYGEPAATPGLHVMHAPTESPIEIVTGLGGTGAEIMLAHVGDVPVPAHPMIPLLGLATDREVGARFGADLDLTLDAKADDALAALETLLSRIASRDYRPALFERRIVGFQLTRGLLGISM